MGWRTRNRSTRTLSARWFTSAPWKRARRPRRRKSWPGYGETLECRTLLSAMPFAEVGGVAGPADSPIARGESRVPVDREAKRAIPVRGGAATAQQQRYVEVLVFIDSGPFRIGHADIALTDGNSTTVYGQHATGAGNGGFDDSAFQRRSLDVYLRDEAHSGFRVFVSRVPVTEQQFREIRQYLDHKWQNDDDFSLFDDNCSQNVGYVLKEWDLLSKWSGGSNVINDDDFQFPEGDLYNDFIRDDRRWIHREAGYLGSTPAGSSLFDSVQDKAPTGGISSGNPSGNTSTGQTESGSSSRSTEGRGGRGGGRASRTVSGVPEDGRNPDGSRDDLSRDVRLSGVSESFHDRPVS